jgi:hypothetical protein
MNVTTTMSKIHPCMAKNNGEECQRMLLRLVRIPKAKKRSGSISNVFGIVQIRNYPSLLVHTPIFIIPKQPALSSSPPLSVKTLHPTSRNSTSKLLQWIVQDRCCLSDSILEKSQKCERFEVFIDLRSVRSGFGVDIGVRVGGGLHSTSGKNSHDYIVLYILRTTSSWP